MILMCNERTTWFAGIVKDANVPKGDLQGRELFLSDDRGTLRLETPILNYTIRAWRAVVTYLLRQHEFLYE